MFFRSDISIRWTREGTEAPYVPCELDRPSYQMMNDAESDYYFYWRSMVRKGKFLRSCDAYLYLFACEIINTDEGAEENLRNLLNVSKVYRKCSPELLDRIQDACFTYAKLHKLPEPEITRAYEPVLISYQVSKRMKEETVDLMPVSLIRNIMAESDLKYLDDSNPYDELFTRCLRKINALEINHNGRPLLKRLYRKRRMQYPVYSGLRYFGDRERATVETSDIAGDINMRSFLRSTLKCLLREVRVRKGLSAPLPSNYPPAYRQMVVLAVDDWVNGDWSPEDMYGTKLCLNMNGVESARADLNAVSDMMATEESEEVHEEVREDVPAVQDSPWKAFAEQLSEEQKEYVRAAIEGHGKNAAKALGVRLSAMEESVNSVAMDTVGDTVVEDGNAVEDYIDELKEAI